MSYVEDFLADSADFSVEKLKESDVNKEYMKY